MKAPVPVRVTEKDLPRVLLLVAIGVALACCLACYLDDRLGDPQPAFYHPRIGVFLIFYKLSLLFFRYHGHGTYVLYDALWGCNISINLVILAVLLSRPFLIGVAMAIVSGDQLCWYIDAIGFLCTGVFPVGVIKYLTYPENRSFSKQFFASHHLWFLPLCFWLTHGHGGMHSYSFIAACAMTAFLAAYSRLVSPFEVELHANGEKSIVYVNTNGAFAFWKDIHIPILHVVNHRHPLLYLPYLTIVGNLVVNGLPHLVLLGISTALEPHT